MEQPGDALVALEEPDKELTRLLGDRAKVVKPYPGGPGGRVALSVLDAAVVGRRAYLGSPLRFEERVEPGVYARRSVVEPLRREMEGLWRISPEHGELPGESWRAKRRVAEAYARWRFPRGERSLPDRLQELREEFRRGYVGSKDHLTRVEGGFWSRVDAGGLGTFIDDVEVAPRVDRLDLMAPEKSLPGEPEPSAELLESLMNWAAEAEEEVRRAAPASGLAARRLAVDGSAGRGLLLVVASLLEDSPSWRDSLFAAGATVLLESVGDS